MNTQLKDELVKDYNQLMINMSDKTIKQERLGYYTDTCNAMLLSILIHCMENIEIFDDEQTNNIRLYFNKINYGG